jgi:hypothetical protein
MSRHSGHSNANNNYKANHSSKTQATKATRTSRGVNKTIKILTLRNQTPQIHKAIQEIANFVVTAKYLTTPKKNAEKE